MGGEGESQRRRRRRRGRGGRGRDRDSRDVRDGRQDVPSGNDQSSVPPANGDAPVRDFISTEPLAQPPRAPEPPPSSEPAPPPQSSALPPDASPGESPKPTQTYTVWSSTPGDGHHFGPKD